MFLSSIIFLPRRELDVPISRCGSSISSLLSSSCLNLSILPLALVVLAGADHLILLVKNETGHRNLIFMVSKAFTEGFYRKPRIDYELLSEHSEGLIALSACLAAAALFFVNFFFPLLSPESLLRFPLSDFP